VAIACLPVGRQWIGSILTIVIIVIELRLSIEPPKSRARFRWFGYNMPARSPTGLKMVLVRLFHFEPYFDSIKV